MVQRKEIESTLTKSYKSRDQEQTSVTLEDGPPQEATEDELEMSLRGLTAKYADPILQFHKLII